MSRRITKNKLADGIYLLRFETQYELAATFLRVQEHYESSRFSGRIFSLEQYMDWYAARFGGFTYYEDWSGFNVPSTALEAFYKGKFEPLLQKEKRFLRLFKHERAPFYVIGVSNSALKRDLIHELAHALFFTNGTYRQAVRAAMRGYDTSAMKRELTRLGYARHVIQDEVHAYLVAPTGELGGSRKLSPLGKKLRALFKQHSGVLSGLKRHSGVLSGLSINPTQSRASMPSS
jgi:hypothetical protein